MTDIELLPSSVAAFVEALKGERGSLDAWLEVNNEREVAAHVEAYARAVAEHSVKEWDAEIEALRAEVTRRIEAFADRAEQLEARADRLAEALRELLIDMKQAQANMRAAARKDPRWEGCAEAIQPRVDPPTPPCATTTRRVVIHDP